VRREERETIKKIILMGGSKIYCDELPKEFINVFNPTVVKYYFMLRNLGPRWTNRYIGAC
jgi:hypothetical protein